MATFVGVLVDRKRGLNSMKREELNSSQNNVKIEMDWADNRVLKSYEYLRILTIESENNRWFNYKIIFIPSNVYSLREHCLLLQH